MKILEWLRGKRTYIICLSAIFGAIAAYVTDQIALKEMIVAITAALIGITERIAISDVKKKVSPED